jgi:hypothetical protein
MVYLVENILMLLPQRLVPWQQVVIGHRSVLDVILNQLNSIGNGLPTVFGNEV